jgi:Cu2+-exporting ATPase
MNSLIALGATTSFAAGGASALLPGFALDPSFLEEPVMLLAFVLLGRSLEARARAAASADLTALARLIPDTARLVLDPGAAPRQAAAGGGAAAAEEALVATASVRAGDVVRVLPGERIPVDGVVLGGKASGGWGGWAVGGWDRVTAEAAGRVEAAGRAGAAGPSMSACAWHSRVGFTAAPYRCR